MHHRTSVARHGLPGGESDRIPAMLAACLHDSARGRARTAAHLRVAGPGATPRALLMGLTTALVALALLRMF
jgi:hypothetical protein